jgi:Fe-S cluster biogenesis protein NfuA
LADPDATGPQIIDDHTHDLGHDLNPLATTLTDGEANAVSEIDGDPTIIKLCRDVLSPLVVADGGVMFVVKASAEDVHLHLTGTCAGCPGASYTRDGVIAPAIRTVAAKARVVVTTGPRVPDGAKRI